MEGKQETFVVPVINPELHQSNTVIEQMFMSSQDLNTVSEVVEKEINEDDLDQFGFKGRESTLLSC